MPLTPSIQTDHVGGAYIVKLAQLGDVDSGNVSVSAEVLPVDDALSDDASAFGFDSTEEYTAARGLIDLERLPDNGPIEPQESLPDVSDADNGEGRASNNLNYASNNLNDSRFYVLVRRYG